MSTPPETTDYSKHTDEQLREGIRKADEELDRIAHEDSQRAVDVNRQQREAMAEELARRENQST
jgi:hypothetical protein